MHIITVTDDELTAICAALAEYADTYDAADEAGVDPHVNWEAIAAGIRELADRLSLRQPSES